MARIPGGAATCLFTNIERSTTLRERDKVTLMPGTTGACNGQAGNVIV